MKPPFFPVQNVSKESTCRAVFTTSRCLVSIYFQSRSSVCSITIISGTYKMNTNTMIFISHIKKNSSTSYLWMGNVQNWHLYIRYWSSFIKSKANECKKLTDYIPLLLYCSIIQFISSAITYQSWENKMWNFNFVRLFSFFFCEYYTYQTSSLLQGIFPFPVWGCVRATTG